MIFAITSALALQPVQKEISLLTLTSFKNGQVALPACSAAIDFVVNHVNNRSDILADYKLTLQYENLGDFGAFSNNALFKYLRSDENKTILPIVLISQNCESVGRTIKHQNMVILSPYCHGIEMLHTNIHTTLYTVHSKATEMIFCTTGPCQTHWPMEGNCHTC